jgi:sulfite reductase (NADPH) flavoprotein alpha-component
MLNYFGYGSNINFTSLKAKGVLPKRSYVGRLPCFKLKFNVEHWFRHEGGMGNIEPSDDPADFVEGMVHECTAEDLEALDQMEAYGVGYDRIHIKVNTREGIKEAFTYTGLPEIINEKCLPTPRYLNIILKGAREAGLSKGYIEKLEKHPLFHPKEQGAFKHFKDVPIFNALSLSSKPLFTALAGAVFDMRGSRKELEYLHTFFGGKDMTLFHLKRLDTSDGGETIEDFINGNLTAYQQQYLNNYLHEYAEEFSYVGSYDYEI